MITELHNPVVSSMAETKIKFKHRINWELVYSVNVDKYSTSFILCGFSEGFLLLFIELVLVFIRFSIFKRNTRRQ